MRIRSIGLDVINFIRRLKAKKPVVNTIPSLNAAEGRQTVEVPEWRPDLNKVPTIIPKGLRAFTYPLPDGEIITIYALNQKNADRKLRNLYNKVVNNGRKD
jgi:hypothetical protein